MRFSSNRPVFLVFAQIVREAEKGERLRLAKTPRLPIPGGEPPELDQPCLLGIQLQAELRDPAAKISKEPLSVIPVLEARHEVVRKPRDDHITMRVLTSPLVSPQVEDVVKVNICKERRNRSLLATFPPASATKPCPR
jgi:hypothetical protein